MKKNIIKMNLKTLVESEEKYYNLFFKQFNFKEDAEYSWSIIEKPTSYPCIVIKSCGRYIYVYPNDFGEKH